MLRSNSVTQILAVLRYIQKYVRNGDALLAARHRATQTVAQEQSPPIRYQTIEDLYRRRLALEKVNDFDTLVQTWTVGDPEPLRQQLNRHADPSTHDLITAFFQDHTPHIDASLETTAQQVEERPPKPYSVELAYNENRMLRFIAESEGLDDSALLTRIVSQAIRNEFKTLAQRIH